MVHCASPLFTARAAKELKRYGHKSCAEFPLLAQTRSAGMSAIRPLLGDKRTLGGQRVAVAIDPQPTMQPGCELLYGIP